MNSIDNSGGSFPSVSTSVSDVNCSQVTQYSVIMNSIDSSGSFPSVSTSVSDVSCSQVTQYSVTTIDSSNSCMVKSRKQETDFVRFMLHYQCISVVTKIMFDKELLISVSILAEAQITTVVDVSD